MSNPKESCFKCGTTEDVEDNQMRQNKKRYECFKCSIKLRYKLTLPYYPVDKEWIEKAKASHKLILERRT